jgi:hypothetical protein
MRYTIITVAAMVAVSITACGSHTSGTPTASKTSSAATSTPTPPPAKAKDHVAGLISSVSGNTVQVRQKDTNATVDFGNSTKISSILPASLTDVTTGSCVVVRPTRDSDANSARVTAASVQIVPASDGRCPQQHNGKAVHGSVNSVIGTTVTVATDGSAAQVAVSVTGDTRYAKYTAADAQAISEGQCLTAQGTKDSSGALQATSLTVRAANNGLCGGAHK